MIKHAMKFPSVTKIVYSTCSIHAIENEEVVCAALESDEAKQGQFVLAPRDSVLPTWPRRGQADKMTTLPASAESLVRCDPTEDRTNGFFVSCFVKKPKEKQTASSTSGGELLQQTKRTLEDTQTVSPEKPRKKRKKKK